MSDEVENPLAVESASPPDSPSTGGVFVSHVSEDKPIADAFTTLLRDATAGALNVYASTATTQDAGIRYGSEWFQWILERIERSDHVVALLTPRSTEKPWILFEAGLGKAKTGGTVFGLALGLTVSKASSGPFAVFQNSASDPTSVKKLCREVIAESGANPRDKMLDQLVESFLEEIEPHLATADAGVSESNSELDASAIFQSIEDIKFLIRSRDSNFGREGSRVDRDYIHELISIVSNNREIPLSTRLKVISGVGREVGMDAIAGLLDNLPSRIGSDESLHRIAGAGGDLMRSVRPWSGESDHFLYEATQLFDEWVSTQGRRLDARTRIGPRPPLDAP